MILSSSFLGNVFSESDFHREVYLPGKIKAVAIGASAGGLKALRELLYGLGKDFGPPLILVQHLSSELDFGGTTTFAQHLGSYTRLSVREAGDKDEILGSTLYVSPPDYHLLVEKDGFFSLSKDPKVSFSRPSIDVLFESAADAFGDGLVAVVLSGANSDGADGAASVSRRGGMVVVQDPDTADSRVMPCAAISKLEGATPALVLPAEAIGKFLAKRAGLVSYANRP